MRTALQPDPRPPEDAAVAHSPAAELLLALSECWLFAEGLRVGYFLWVGSMALLVLAGWCGLLQADSAPVTRGAGEASRIAARFAASRLPVLPPVEQDAYRGRERAR